MNEQLQQIHFDLAHLNGSRRKNAQKLIDSLDKSINDLLVQQKAISKKMRFIDVLQKTSRLPFMRESNRAFAEMCADQFITQAALTCLEIKRKYGVKGVMTPDKCLDIIFSENGAVDDSEENREGEDDTYIAPLKNGRTLIWIDPNMETEKAFRYMFVGLALFLSPTDLKLSLENKRPQTEEALIDENPELFRSILATDILAAMLQSDETYKELQEIIDREKKEKQPKILDLSALPESVQRLNKQQTEKLIKKYHLPAEVSDVLRSCVEAK